MNSKYDPQKKVYQVGDKQFSIIDLLHSAIDEQYMDNGIPRISDFHFTVGEAVRFRLDSDLQIVVDGAPLTQEVAEELIYSLLSEEKLETLLNDPSSDLDAGFVLEGTNFSFRMNVFRDRCGLAAVIRLLPPKIPDVDEVGFPFDDTYEDICSLKQGLVLVTGVTGSGKSTTIASFLNHINQTRRIRAITLEDPIEYVFSSEQSLISQREVGEHVSSFSQGLFSAMRENPDVIYVGEMRDMETASLALTAAETGHLVFSTLHTRDVTGAITRLVDMFPAEKSTELLTQLSFSLSYVIGQKLVNKVDGVGRCVAMEILKNVPGLANSIRTGKWHMIYSLMETRMSEGMITMEQCLLNLFREGLITRDEAISNSNNPANIIEYLPKA